MQVFLRYVSKEMILHFKNEVFILNIGRYSSLQQRGVVMANDRIGESVFQPALPSSQPAAAPAKGKSRISLVKPDETTQRVQAAAERMTDTTETALASSPKPHKMTADVQNPSLLKVKSLGSVEELAGHITPPSNERSHNVEQELRARKMLDEASRLTSHETEETQNGTPSNRINGGGLTKPQNGVPVRTTEASEVQTSPDDLAESEISDDTADPLEGLTDEEIENMDPDKLKELMEKLKAGIKKEESEVVQLQKEVNDQDGATTLATAKQNQLEAEQAETAAAVVSTAKELGEETMLQAADHVNLELVGETASLAKDMTDLEIANAAMALVSEKFDANKTHAQSAIDLLRQEGMIEDLPDGRIKIKATENAGVKPGDKIKYRTETGDIAELEVGHVEHISQDEFEQFRARLPQAIQTYRQNQQNRVTQNQTRHEHPRSPTENHFRRIVRDLRTSIDNAPIADRRNEIPGTNKKEKLIVTMQTMVRRLVHLQEKKAELAKKAKEIRDDKVKSAVEKDFLTKNYVNEFFIELYHEAEHLAQNYHEIEMLKKIFGGIECSPPRKQVIKALIQTIMVLDKLPQTTQNQPEFRARRAELVKMFYSMVLAVGVNIDPGVSNKTHILVDKG